MNSLLERRRIEAEFAKGILDVLTEEIGRERAVETIAKAIIKAAETAGETFAASTENGRTDLDAYAEILKIWQMNDALSLDLKARDADRLEFDVTRCRYAEMYRELGLSDLGAILSCNRDDAFSNGFNKAIKLTRTQTIMGGDTHCDFRYKI